MTQEHENEQIIVEASQAFSTKDYPRALSLLQPLVDSGHAAATGMLGLAYKTGSGVAIDGERAVELLQKAVELGDAFAAHNLGRIYMEGMQGIEANNELSNLYYSLAKEMGLRYEKVEQ